MPKPIVLMYIPGTYYLPGENTANVMMQNMNGWNNKVIPDPEIKKYLWLVFEKNGIDAPEIQVFHPKDFTETQYDDLKSLVIDHLRSIRPINSAKPADEL